MDGGTEARSAGPVPRRGTLLPLPHFGQWIHRPRRQATGPVPKPRSMPLPHLLYAPGGKLTRRRQLVHVRYHVVCGTREAVQQRLTAYGWQTNTACIEESPCPSASMALWEDDA